MTETVRGASVVGAVGAVVAETDQPARFYTNHGYFTLADFLVLNLWILYGH